MSRLKLTILLGFAMAFAAGWAVGKRVSIGDVKQHLARLGVGTTPPPPATQPSQNGFPNLRQELGLSDDQEKRMEEIWKNARSHADGVVKQIRDLDQKRDEQVLSLLTPEQKPAYEQIQHDSDAQVATLRSEISSTMHNAEQTTRGLLNPEQQKKFDEIVKQHGHHRGPPPPGMLGHHPWHDGASTRPSTTLPSASEPSAP